MSNPKIITNEFTILKNGIDPTLEIIRHDKTGFYNITKTANMLASINYEFVDEDTIRIDKHARNWFRNKTTDQLIAECQRITKVDIVRYELGQGVPKQFSGTYVHELLYDHFIMWLSPIYAMRISAILRTYHKEIIRTVTTRIRLCATPNCTTRANVRRYQGYCFECFYEHNPNDPIICNYKFKESTIMNSISEAIGYDRIIRDKIISGSGCKRRPDGLIRLADLKHNIVIEIDEYQHKDPGYVDEDQRIYEIYNALNQQALTVIRFNPDHFNGLRNGLFSKSNATGLIDIGDHERYTHAIGKLIEVIRRAIETPPAEPDSIVEIKLRFDHTE